MAQKLKIAFVSQPFDGVRPPNQNSVGISVFELSRDLAKKHDVSVVTIHRQGRDEPNLDVGVTITTCRSIQTSGSNGKWKGSQDCFPSAIVRHF